MVEGATVHGATLDPFMDFYPVQIEALKALWVAIHDSTAVEYKAPLDSNGNTSTVYEQSVAYGSFAGFISHYHVSKQKIDCANLDLKTMVEEVKCDEE